MADTKFKEEVEQAFAAVEAATKVSPGLYDALLVADQVDPWLKSVDAYLTAVSPTPPVTSASSTTIISGPPES